MFTKAKQLGTQSGKAAKAGPSPSNAAKQAMAQKMQADKQAKAPAKMQADKQAKAPAKMQQMGKLQQSAGAKNAAAKQAKMYMEQKAQKASMGPKPAGGAPKQQQLMALANKLRATGPKPAGGGVGSPMQGLGATAAKPAMKKGGMARKRYT